jgi:hypothetical protein
VNAIDWLVKLASLHVELLEPIGSRPVASLMGAAPMRLRNWVGGFMNDVIWGWEAGRRGFGFREVRSSSWSVLNSTEIPD